VAPLQPRPFGARLGAGCKTKKQVINLNPRAKTQDSGQAPAIGPIRSGSSLGCVWRGAPIKILPNQKINREEPQPLVSPFEIEKPSTIEGLIERPFHHFFEILQKLRESKFVAGAD
jgi:hypothetical protein